MSKYRLHPHQQKLKKEIFKSLFSSHYICCCAPTGSGKTVLAQSVINDILTVGKKKDSQIFFIVNREELVNQSEEKFQSFADQISIIKSERDDEFNANKRVQLIMSQTFYARRDKLSQVKKLSPALIIIDECHEGWEAKRLSSIKNMYPQAKLLALTATPICDKGYLLDGFDQHIMNIQIPDLQCPDEYGKRYLAKEILYLPEHYIDFSQIAITGGDYNEADMYAQLSQSNLVTNVVENFTKIAFNLKALVFCINTAHAEIMKEKYLREGYRTAVLHSQIKNLKTERVRIMREFNSGKIQVLVTVRMATTGVDVPTIECIVDSAPTLSARLDMQKKGRGLRYIEGIKESCVIIDCAGNTQIHGPLSEFRYWEPKPKTNRVERAKRIVRMKQCETCGCWNPTIAKICTNCGCELFTRKEKTMTDTEMMEVENPVINEELIIALLNKLAKITETRIDIESTLRDFYGTKPAQYRNELFYKVVYDKLKIAFKMKYSHLYVLYELSKYFSKFKVTA